MYPVVLLIALMFLTWAAAVVATYVGSDKTSSDKRAGEAEDSYYDAA